MAFMGRLPACARSRCQIKSDYMLLVIQSTASACWRVRSRCWGAAGAERQRHLATGRCLAWLPPLRDVLTAMRMAGTVHALRRSEARRGNGCTRARMHGHVMSTV